MFDALNLALVGVGEVVVECGLLLAFLEERGLVLDPGLNI